VKDIVWDPAAFHKGKAVGEGRPPYSPESYGAVLEEVRQWIEGKIYGSIDAKLAAVESFLRSLAADKARVRRLTGYPHIRAALGG